MWFSTVLVSCLILGLPMKLKKNWLSHIVTSESYQICDKDLDLQKNWTKVKLHQINSSLRRRKDKDKKNKFRKIINKLKNWYNFCVGYFSLKHKPSPKAVPFYSCSLRKGAKFVILEGAIPKCRTADFWNEQKRLCRRTKRIISSWFDKRYLM